MSRLPFSKGKRDSLLQAVKFFIQLKWAKKKVSKSEEYQQFILDTRE